MYFIYLQIYMHLILILFVYIYLSLILNYNNKYFVIKKLYFIMFFLYLKIY
jgi:hypothetical protein